MFSSVASKAMLFFCRISVVVCVLIAGGVFSSYEYLISKYSLGFIGFLLIVLVVSIWGVCGYLLCVRRWRGKLEVVATNLLLISACGVVALYHAGGYKYFVSDFCKEVVSGINSSNVGYLLIANGGEHDTQDDEMAAKFRDPQYVKYLCNPYPIYMMWFDSVRVCVENQRGAYYVVDTMALLRGEHRAYVRSGH